MEEILKKVNERKLPTPPWTHIYLLTDGYVDDREKVIDLVKANFGSHLIELNVFGLGSCVDEDLVKGCAKAA